MAPIEKVECYICGKLCAPKMIKIHMSSHTNPVLYDCETCFKRFSSQKNLKAHMKLHDSCLMCEECAKRFHTEEEFRSHVCTTVKERNHTCNYCQKAFLSNHDLKRHVRSHTNEKPFKCDECGKGFTQKSNRDLHTKQHHKNPNAVPVPREKKYVCPICYKAFGYKTHLNRHHRIHTGERPHVCTICQKGFIQRWQMRLHMEGHSDEKKYLCEECGKSFKLKATLDSHKKSHNKHFLFCRLCDKSFNDKNKYQHHYDSVHLQLNRYVCDICHKGFYTHILLKSHYLSHARQKIKQKCSSKSDDNRKNTSKSHAKEILKKDEHQNFDKNGDNVSTQLMNKIVNEGASVFDKNSGVKSYTCQVCDKFFFQLAALKRHSASHKRKQLKVNRCPIEVKKKENNSNETDKDSPLIKAETDSDTDDSGHKDSLPASNNNEIELDTEIRMIDDDSNLIESESFLKQFPEEGLYKCHVCQKLFEREALLESHHLHYIQRHSKCCLCDKKFDVLSSLLEHHEIHENSHEYAELRPSFCIECHTEFPDKLTLKNHGKNCHNQNLKCCVCAQFFENNEKLEEHKLVHNVSLVEKPYVCFIAKGRQN